MSQRVILLVSCLLIYVAPATQAQTIELDNVLVNYFDEEATVPSWYGLGEVTVYLVAGPLLKFKDVWEPYATLNSFVADYWIWPEAHVSGAVLMPRGTAFPPTVDLGDSALMQEIQYLEPLPLNGRTVVAELTLTVLSEASTWLWAMGFDFMADCFRM